MKNRVVTTAIAFVFVDAGWLVTVAVFPTLAIAINPDLPAVFFPWLTFVLSGRQSAFVKAILRPADHIAFNRPRSAHIDVVT
jgi:hypothetical protein